jgi:hypothetical protein
LLPIQLDSAVCPHCLQITMKCCRFAVFLLQTEAGFAPF